MKNLVPRKRDPKHLHLKRATAQVSVVEGIATTRDIVKATVVLNDLNLRGLFLFSSSQLAIGQRVTISINEPRSFYIRGRVVACKMLSLQNNIIAYAHYPYRIGILFEFRSIEERISIKKYCDEIRNVYLASASNC